MQLRLLSVGKAKSAPLTECVRDYLARLQRHGSVEWVTVPSEDVAPRASPAAIEVALAKEAERLVARLPAQGMVVALDRDGQAWSSLEWARALADWQGQERQVVFVVGSAFGLHPKVLQRARLRLSLSRLTLPHELALVVLAEQLYRAHTILRREPYHK